jgi:ABC-type multidrug transport system fused ATPase/permease subunit
MKRQAYRQTVKQLNAFIYTQIVFWVLSGQRQITRLRQACFKTILFQDVSWFDTHSHAEITTRLTA